MQALLNSLSTTLLTVTLLAVGTTASPVRAGESPDQLITLAIDGSQPEVNLARSAAKPEQPVDTVAVGSWLDGNNIPDVPTLTKGRYKAMDAGSSATCAIAWKDGHIVCWGLNDFGQANSLKGRYVDISMGQYHGCAIHANRTLACWGLPEAMPQGQQGRGRYQSVSAGDDHTCAIRKDKSLECWGDNSFGELNAPPGTFQTVSARGNHTCAVSTDQQLICWGEEDFTAHTPASGLFTNVSTGVLHGCALRAEDGLAVCWGNNAFGQATPPIQDRFVSLVSGDYHTCGLRADHTASCWGRNQFGQTDLPSGDYQRIAAGGAQSCALTSEEGELHCVGSFAFSPMLMEKATAAPVARNGRSSSPQFAWSVFMPGLTSVLNVAVGNGLEVMFKGGLSKAEKGGKLAGIGFALLGFVLGQTLPGDDKPDPYLPLLEDIQTRVKDLQKGLNTVAAEVKMTKATLDNLSCKDSATTISVAAEYVKSDASGSMPYGPAYEMQLLLGKYSKLLALREQRDQKSYNEGLADLFVAVNKFKNDWTRGKENLQKHNDLIVDSLLAEKAGSISPLDACKAKSRNNWIAKKAYPFDDRPIWEESYRVLASARATQVVIATLASQLVGFDLLAATIGPNLNVDGTVTSDPTSPITDYDISEEQAQSICEKADYQKTTNSRWNRVSSVCEAVKQDARKRYVEQVRIAEKMGGAYSDANVVLSLTAQQMGNAQQGSPVESNWLWVRDPGVRDFRESSYHRYSDYRSMDNQSPFSGMLGFVPGKSNGSLYYVNVDAEGNKSYGDAVWHSSGKAWDDLFQARETIRKEWKLDDTYEDVPSRMAAEISHVESDCKKNNEGNCVINKERNETGQWVDKEVKGDASRLFTNVKYVPFYLLAAKGEIRLAHTYLGHKGEPALYASSFPFRGSLSSFLPAVVASGINQADTNNMGKQPYGGHWYHPDKTNEKVREYLKLSGRVSNELEAAAVLISAKVKDLNTRDCNTQGICLASNDCNQSGECAGLGWGPFSNKTFGVYQTDKWFVNGGSNPPRYLARWNWSYETVQEWWRDSLIDREKTFTHFPVLNVNKRKCFNSAVATNAIDVEKYNDPPQFRTLRVGSRTVDGIAYPSICGADLDEFIKQMMTRPDPAYVEIPEIRVIP